GAVGAVLEDPHARVDAGTLREARGRERVVAQEVDERADRRELAKTLREAARNVGRVPVRVEEEADAPRDRAALHVVGSREGILALRVQDDPRAAVLSVALRGRSRPEGRRFR